MGEFWIIGDFCIMDDFYILDSLNYGWLLNYWWLLNYGWLLNYRWILNYMGGKHTDKRTHRHTNTNINTMTRPGLGAGPSEISTYGRPLIFLRCVDNRNFILMKGHGWYSIGFFLFVVILVTYLKLLSKISMFFLLLCGNICLISIIIEELFSGFSVSTRKY